MVEPCYLAPHTAGAAEVMELSWLLTRKEGGEGGGREEEGGGGGGGRGEGGRGGGGSHRSRSQRRHERTERKNREKEATKPGLIEMRAEEVFSNKSCSFVCCQTTIARKRERLRATFLSRAFVSLSLFLGEKKPLKFSVTC